MKRSLAILCLNFLFGGTTPLQETAHAEGASDRDPATAVRLAAEPVLFEKEVRPILKEHCFQCHGEGGKKEGDLDLRLRRLMMVGGEHGPVIVPGQPEKSLLFVKVRDGKMPKGQ
ncbi:uncharacterized protein METZ01_LOCUS418084, partial [marine metagenome]